MCLFQAEDLAGYLRCRRDTALLLIGFWRGFRSDELCRLQVEHIQAEAGAGMTLFCLGARVTGTTLAPLTTYLR